MSATDRSKMRRDRISRDDGSSFWRYEDGHCEDVKPEDIPRSPYVQAYQTLASFMPPKLWLLDPTAPVIPVDPEKLAQFDALGVRQPLLRRLLLALTYNAVRRVVTGDATPLLARKLADWIWPGGTLPRDWRRQPLLARKLADWIWPGGTLPRDWRRQLLRIGAAAVAAGQLKGFSIAADGSVKCPLAIHVLYGALAQVLFGRDAEGKAVYCTSLPLAYPKPGRGDRTIVQKLIASGVCDVRDDRGDIDDKATRSLAQARVKGMHDQRATVPSIATLRSQGKLVMAFVPALLGTPPDAATARVMHTLIGERSTGTARTAKIRDAKVANFSSRDLWVCPLLDATAVYATFGGNHTAHRGCGYRPAHWAKIHGTSVAEFYAELAAVAEVLGLTVVGVSRQRKWYSLDDLRALPGKNDIALRIHAPEDWDTRWAALCQWQPETPPPNPDDPAPETGPAERQILQARVKELGGVKAVAAAMKLKGHAALSLALSGRRDSPRLMAALRQHVADAVPALDPAEAFSGITDDSPIGDWALAYRRLGWQVLPLRPGTTATYFRYKDAGYQTHLATEDEVRAWWGQWPTADIGLLLGPISGVFAIDCDTEEGYVALLRELTEEPVAPNVMSGSYDTEHWWKMHWLFRHPAVATNARYTPWDDGLEFRGTNGLLRLPPSLSQKTGRPYRWVKERAIWSLPLPKVPAKILLALRKRLEKPAPLKLAAPVKGQAPRGQLAKALAGEFAHAQGWNNQLYTAACAMRKKGIPLADAEAQLVEAFDPVDAANEMAARKTIRSAYSNLKIAH